MLAPLTVLLFGGFIILWVFDIIFTKRCVDKLGPEIELNPIIRGLLGIRARYMLLLKSLELLVYGLVYFFVQRYDEVLALKLLMLAMIAYSTIILAGMRIYLLTTNSKTIILVLFALIITLALSFAYIAFLEQDSKATILNALKECYTSKGGG